jgi:hypothetical protein
MDEDDDSVDDDSVDDETYRSSRGEEEEAYASDVDESDRDAGDRDEFEDPIKSEDAGQASIKRKVLSAKAGGSAKKQKVVVTPQKEVG